MNRVTCEWCLQVVGALRQVELEPGKRTPEGVQLQGPTIGVCRDCVRIIAKHYKPKGATR